MRVLSLIVVSLLMVAGSCNGRTPPFEPESVQLGSDGILYLHAPDKNAIFRFSVAQDRYLPKIALDPYSRYMTYVPAHHALYFTYGGARIHKVDLTVSPPRPEPFADLPNTVYGIGAAGSFLFVASTYNLHVLRPDGSQADESGYAQARAQEYSWDPVRSRLYWIEPHDADLLWREIDPVNGLFVASGASPYNSDFPMGQPVRASADGSQVLVAARRYFDANALDFQGALPAAADDAIWLADGGVVTIGVTEDGQTRLDHWDAARNRFNSQRFPGAPIRIFDGADPGESLVVTQGPDRPMVSTYVPTTDPDSDGLPNSADAFPLDPAASEDSDRDHFPDAWNPGMGAADSTTGLALDAFPLDSACWLPGHGAGGVCGIEAALPAYSPTRIVMGADDVVYLFSPEQDRVFRWSAVEERHLNPIVTGRSPDLMAYSPVTHRLYLGYPDDTITWIDAAAPDAEEPLAVVFAGLHGLATAGEFVMAADTTGAWSAHYTFAPSGEWISWADWNYAAPDFAWSPAAGRFYFWDRFTSPQALRWEAIDDVTGQIVGDGGIVLGSWHVANPLRPSPDGSRLLLGNGVLRDGTTLELAGSLAVDPSDAAWLADGGLLTIRPGAAGDTIVEQWDAAFGLVTQRLVAGSPLRVLESGAGFVVVTDVAGRPTFHPHTLGPDGDGDGVPSPADAFPLDPAASLDSDGDGYPDSWNPGMGAADSTTGLSIDAFPLEAACWLAAQGSGGVCDIAGAIPVYDPAEVTIGVDDVVYLFSPETDRIYRWSAALGQHLDPIPVGGGATHAAYAPDTHRFYLAYPSGAITEIDLGSSPVEAPFAVIYGVPNGLTTAGDLVVATNYASGWNARYIFNPAGQLVDYDTSNQVSRAYGWSPANRRLYQFTDGSSTPGMRWEEIDPGGTAVDELDADWDPTLAPPIRPSPDGERVLVGSGAIYDGTRLLVRDSLPEAIVDARWASDGRLLVLRADEAGGGLVDQRANDLTFWSTEAVAGVPLRLLEWSDGFVYVSSVGGRPAFTAFVPVEDVDGDGAANAEDAFPTDPAASQDADADGSPDAWNPGMGSGDSTTGLVLDAFPLDFACQLPEHGVGGVCDFTLVIPADPAVPLCDRDDVELLPQSGELDLEPASDFVPLCSGWLLYGDRDGFQLMARELSSNRLGLSIPLPGIPGDLELDAEAKVLYVALPREDKLAAVDLVTEGVTITDLPDTPAGLSLGNGGDLWLLLGPSFLDYIYRLPGDGMPLEGGWSNGAGALMRYNRSRDEIIIAGIGSYNSLRRFSWDGASLVELETNQSAGWHGHDAAISPDDQHLVYASDSFGGVSAASDWSTADVRVQLGIFAVDGPARALAFSPTSQRLAIGTDTSLSIWDPSVYTEIDSMPLPDCDYALTAQVGFSRGGGLALAKQECGYRHSSSTFHWLRVD